MTLIFHLTATVLLVLAIVLTMVKRLEGGYFWYFALMVLGYAPGLRDTLTIILLG